MNPKERFLNACRRGPVDRPPVWIMRQAGRYLPEYRAIREKKKTLEMMQDPETACAITLQPVERIGVDAAILYSDILMVPAGMGLRLDFVRGEGPTFENPIWTAEDVEQLDDQKGASRCDYVYQTIELLRKKLIDFPLLGFAGAPFTVGTYMVAAGARNKEHSLKKLIEKDIRLFHKLMRKITRTTIDYLTRQVEAGVDAIQLFDTWAGTLSSDEYASIALPYEKEIFAAMARLSVPTILYIKGGAPHFRWMLQSSAQVIGLDSGLPLSTARQIAGNTVALQGNLDPETLLRPIPEIEKSVESMIHDWGKGPGYIINLGHGILKETPVEHARAFVEAAKKFGKQTI